MASQIIFISLTVLLLLGVLLLFVVKSGLQLQYLNIKNRKKPGAVWDIIKFSFSDKKARQQRIDAFLLFPMLYPVVLDDSNAQMLSIKKRVKKIHIGIYFSLILLVVLAVYSEKVFPATV
jgi:hypothetical protein